MATSREQLSSFLEHLRASFRAGLRATVVCGAILAAIAALTMLSGPAAQAGGVRPQQMSRGKQTNHEKMRPHMDHHPKHGGIFFMAMDNRHHLEGLLLPTGRFRVYVYDAYTRPVSAAELRRVDATVLWGDADNAPQSRLVAARNGQWMEAAPPAGRPKLPVTLTLLAHFPGESLKARPELFTFPFRHFRTVRDTGRAHSSGAPMSHSMHMEDSHAH